VGIVITIPIFIIFTSFFSIDQEIWLHLKTYVLPELILNTIKLVLGVSIGTLLIGVTLAYINSFYDYPGRKLLSLLAVMPMSIPTYIMAFVYVALFDITGIWSLKMRELLGMAGFFPSIRNVYGISFVLSLCLYPYVYLLAKNAFESLGTRALEVSCMMGMGKRKTFFKVIFPLAKPWILSGLILALMETLADFGAVSIFNYTTFTTAIYRSWFGLFSLKSAEQIAAILISVIFIFMLLEKILSYKKKFTTIGRGQAKPVRIRISFLKGLPFILFSSLVSLFAFFIPVITIFKWGIGVMKRDLDERYFYFVWNSIQISLLTVITLLFFTTIMAYTLRKYPGIIATAIKSFSSLGYAVPGTVLAVGVFIFVGSGLHALIIGLAIRFYSISLAPISNAFLRISDSQFHVLELSNNSLRQKLFQIIGPMIKPGLLTAALMVFVEVMKEMPITLMTRPFGKETLAIRIFEMTSEGEWQRAALPSLFLIIISFIPTLFLFYQSEKSE